LLELEPPPQPVLQAVSTVQETEQTIVYTVQDPLCTCLIIAAIFQDAT